ncbi:MAG: hypothetical protein AB7K68_09140 [Bacteriovoracia bacterium]
MKSILYALVAFALSAPAFAHPGHGNLAFAEGKLHAHLSWLVEPNTKGEAKMKLEWRDGSTHEIIEPALPVSVSLWMPDMGHGSAPTQIQRMLDDRGSVIVGTYEVRNMYFMMPGNWEIRVKVKYPSETEETKIWAVSVGGDGGGHDH